MLTSCAWVTPCIPFSGDANSKLMKHHGLSVKRRCSMAKPISRADIICSADAETSVVKKGAAEYLGAWSGEQINTEELVTRVKFNDAGLVPAIAQQWDTGEILMMAWMNADSIRESMRSGRAVYYSRSRKKLWRKGETSGQIQVLRDMLLDCDGDTILMKVDQLGVACHTGRRSCFYYAFRPPSGEPEIIADVLMDPKELYKPK